MRTSEITDFQGTPEADCPYCGCSCWIGVLEEGCEHVFATGDYIGSSESHCLLEDVLEDRLLEFPFYYWERSRADQEAVIDKAKGSAVRVLRAVLAGEDSLFWWSEFVTAHLFEAQVDEPLCSTSYYTVFVKDPKAAIATIRKQLEGAVAAFERHGRRDFLCYLEPAEFPDSACAGGVLCGPLTSSKFQDYIASRNCSPVGPGDVLWILTLSRRRLHLRGPLRVRRFADSDLAEATGHRLFEPPEEMPGDTRTVYPREGEEDFCKEIPASDLLSRLEFVDSRRDGTPRRLAPRNLRRLQRLTEPSVKLLEKTFRNAP